MSNRVYWTFETTIDPADLEACIAFANEAATMVYNDEPNTLLYEYWVSEDKTRCIFHEHFADSDSALAHLGNIQPMMGRMLKLFKFKSWFICGDVSDALRTAVTRNGGQVMEALGDSGFERG